MGMNVLLFLVFQILVEPWRRKRLVKGFEDKVVEALEKEKELNRAMIAESALALSALPHTAVLPEAIDSTGETLENTASLLTEPKLAAAEIDAPAIEVAATADASTSQSLQTRLSNISPPVTSLEYWKQMAHEFFSERTVAVSQRDVTTVALQSAAAGAAVTGLLFALIGSR
jgi:sensitive to high expression protein 9